MLVDSFSAPAMHQVTVSATAACECAERPSQSLPIGTHFDDLVQPLVLRYVKIILLSNGRRHKSALSSSVATPGHLQRSQTWYAPPPDEVSAAEELDERLGRCEANQSSRMKCTAQSRLRWALLDVPRRWRINRRYGKFGLFHGLNNSRKRLAHLTGKAETCER